MTNFFVKLVAWCEIYLIVFFFKIARFVSRKNAFVDFDFINSFGENIFRLTKKKTSGSTTERLSPGHYIDT